MSGARVELRSVVRHFQAGGERVVALDGVDLTIGSGEAVAVVGASGSGKTSVLNLMGALDRPSSGEVLLDGVELGSLGADGRAGVRRRIGIVFQQFRLLGSLSALENVAAPLVPATPSREARQRASAALEEVGLGSRARSRPGELSGGQQQRVALARALVVRPVLLLADEPTGNLDPFTGRGVLELLLGARERHGATLVLVTHDALLASELDRVVRLHEGRVASDRGSISRRASPTGRRRPPGRD